MTEFGCDPGKVEYIFGGVFDSRIDFDFHRDKKLFGKDKNTLDLCFVAHKYGNDLTSKGYDQFVAIAILLSQDNERFRFHVVGDYIADDIPLDGARDKFTFYGQRNSAFFKEFYSRMDAIVSVNRPFSLAPGAFDGFPTGACIEAGFHGVLNCINDPLDLNPVLTSGKDFVLLNSDAVHSATLLRQIFADPIQLYRLSYANWRKFHAVFGTDGQLFARTRIVAAELCRHENLVVPCGPRKSMLDANNELRVASLEREFAALEGERQRLEKVYRELDGQYRDLESHYVELENHYRSLESHYLKVDGERERLEEYIRSKEGIQ